MATEAVSLIPAGTAKYSSFITMLASNGGWNFNNASGHLVTGKSGLCLVFKAYGTALTFRFNSLTNGATYKVKVDGTYANGGSPFTGNASTESSGVTHTWYTGLSNGWHEVRIEDINNNGGYPNWSNAVADLEGGFAGGGGATATYTGSLPGGFTSAFYYADGYGPTSTLAELATDLGSSADVIQGNSTWSEYMKGVAFIGTGTAMTVRCETSAGRLLLYSSTANGSQTATSPCPYNATEIIEDTTVDADGFLSITFTPTNGVHYRLAIGVDTVNSINWSANSRPSGTFAYQAPTFGVTFLGDSTVAAGFTGSTGDLARSTSVYYWVKSGAKVRGMGISGSLASAVTTTGAWNTGLGAFNGLRLPIAAATDTPFLAIRAGINDTLNGNYGFSSAWDVGNTSTSRLMSATTVANDFASAINYISGVNASLRMLVATRYWSVTSNTDYNATKTPLSTAVQGRITAGKLVTEVQCDTWDNAATNAVTLDSGIHPTPAEAGAGNDAERWWQVVNSIINSVTVTSVTITQGASRTVYGEATTTLTATVNVSAGTPSGVTWSVVSGSHSVNSSTGVVTAPGAGQTAKVSVIRATSIDDNTKYANITITTPAQTGASGGGTEMISASSAGTISLGTSYVSVAVLQARVKAGVGKNIRLIVSATAGGAPSASATAFYLLSPGETFELDIDTDYTLWARSDGTTPDSATIYFIAG